MPGDSALLLLRRDVSLNPMNVLLHIERCRIGVARDDGLINQPVFGNIETNPSRVVNTIVFQALPE
jgi:hypothetical protein